MPNVPGRQNRYAGHRHADHTYLWHYTAQWGDGFPAATLHLGEGILAAGETLPWRVMRRDSMRTLLMQTNPGTEALATYYAAGSGVKWTFLPRD